jgi:hypothetical protein
MLRNELGLAICTKWIGRLSQDVVLLHNNTCPQTAHFTINTIQILNWEVLECPAHSADLAPSYFNLFEPIKNARGRRFVDYDEVKRALYQWLHNQPKNFFSRDINKLADCSAKCNEKKGNYIEKYCSSNVRNIKIFKKLNVETF